jgi:hypothetical protein
MSKTLRGLLSLLLLALVLPAFLNLPMLHAQNELLEGKPAYSLAEAKKYVKELVPLVEKATGRKLHKIPSIKLVDREKMIPVLQMEFEPQLENLYPGYSAEQLKNAGYSQSVAYAQAIIGKYGIIDRSLYLLPKNLAPLLKLAKVDEKYTQSILKLTIAHELVHAIQDQETDLKRIRKISNYDELNAFSAIIEGHAVFIQDQVGNALKLEESAIELSRLLSAGAVTYDDPAQEMINQLIATQFEQIYLGGRKFIEYHYQQGGNERVWEIMAKPPRRTAMIAKPETYNPEKQTGVNYRTLVEGLEKELDGTGWQTQNMEVGQMGLRTVYAKIDEPNREAIIAQIEHVQAFIAQNTDPPCIVNVSAIVVKDGNFTKRYMALLEDMIQKNVKEIESSAILQINDFSIVNFTGIKADIAHKISFDLAQGDGSPSVPNRFIRICRSNLLLEFFTNNYTMDDALIIKIAELVFSRYEQMSK